MTEALCQLVYHSRNRIVGSAPDVDLALRDILAAARRNNGRLGVTGALMFNANCFVQVLEGQRATVERLFGTIRNDRRHEGVSLLAFSPVAQRSFAHWSMAFVGGDAHDARFAAFARESGYDPARVSADVTLDFLQKMVRAQAQDPEARLAV